MKRLLKNPLFNVGLLLLIGAIVLYFSLKDDFEGIISSLRAANLQWGYFSFALILLYYYIAGYLLKIYSNLFNPNFSTTQGFIIALIGAFGSGITPSASGGQIFQIASFKKYGVKSSQSASIVWLDFIIYQTTMIVFVAILFVLKFSDYFVKGGPIFYVVLAGFGVNVVIMVILFLLYKSNKFHYWIVHRVITFLHKLKVIKNPDKTISNIDGQIKHFHESSKHIENNRKLLINAVILNVFRLIIYYSLPYFIMLTLNIEIEAHHILDIICLTSFVSMVNAFIPIPGASGGTELTFVSVFAPLVTSGIISVMLVWRFITFYFIVVLGGLIFYLVSRYQISRMEV